MPVSGFMIARAVMRCSNPRRGIAAYIAPMARLPVHRYRKEMAAVRLRQKTKKGLGKRYITSIMRSVFRGGWGLCGIDSGMIKSCPIPEWTLRTERDWTWHD